MKLEQPKWGTCGGCRWWNRDDDAPATSYGQCKRYPPTRWKYTCFPKTPAESWCGEWEPPGGKVCGNCEHSRPMDDDLVACEIRYDERPSTLLNHQRHQLDTCTAWRWAGER